MPLLGVTQQYADHLVIVATHCYMRTEGRYTGCASGYETANSGGQMWQKFIRKQPNIFFVVSGHVLEVALQTSTNDVGGKVLEILSDYQGLANGGDRWLRSLKFVPGENNINGKTSSPLLDQYNNDPHETFLIDYELTVPQRKPG